MFAANISKPCQSAHHYVPVRVIVRNIGTCLGAKKII